MKLKKSICCNYSSSYACNWNGCVGAKGACSGDHDLDNNCLSDNGTAEVSYNDNADNAKRSDYDYSEAENNHRNSTAYGDYDHEDHSSKAADHIKSDHDSD